jgi:hypothetical protein
VRHASQPPGDAEIVKDIGLDFGLLIAYFVPGAITVAALAVLAPELLPATGAGEAADAALWIASALIAGMVVSLLRGSTLDPSFAIDFHRAYLARSKPHYGSCHRVEVDYPVLAKAGTLDAFREAVLQDKRPYQFYGNTLIATVIWAFSVGQLSSTAWVVLVVSWVLLYIGSRRSHFTYMTTVKALNGMPTSAPTGRA